MIDLIVIGGGPAGLMGAISAAQAGASVLLCEKNAVLGRKLAITGSGRCNLTHAGPIGDFVRCYGDQGRFLRPALKGFTNKDLIDFFAARGLATHEEENGKIFPVSGRASDVVGVLASEVRRLGIRLRLGCGVDRVSAASLPPVGRVFEVKAGGDEIRGRAVLIATGGLSYPATGCTGDGIRLAEAMGHRLIPPRPALAAVFVKDYDFGGLSGIALSEVRVSLKRAGKRPRALIGALLFTHRGLSGPVILNVSRFVEPGDRLVVDFLHSGAALDAALVDGGRRQGRQGLKAFLSGRGLPERLVGLCLAHAGVAAGLTLARLDAAKRKAVVASVTARDFEVTGVGGFEEAMATAGGVALDEVDRLTMGSRLVPGLYFAGEVLDVDGDSGGYNLQAAFSSGRLAGAAAVSYLRARDPSGSGRAL